MCSDFKFSTADLLKLQLICIFCLNLCYVEKNANKKYKEKEAEKIDYNPGPNDPIVVIYRIQDRKGVHMHYSCHMR